MGALSAYAGGGGSFAWIAPAMLYYMWDYDTYLMFSSQFGIKRDYLLIYLYFQAR